MESESISTLVDTVAEQVLREVAPDVLRLLDVDRFGIAIADRLVDRRLVPAEVAARIAEGIRDRFQIEQELQRTKGR